MVNVNTEYFPEAASLLYNIGGVRGLYELGRVLVDENVHLVHRHQLLSLHSDLGREELGAPSELIDALQSYLAQLSQVYTNQHS